MSRKEFKLQLLAVLLLLASSFLNAEAQLLNTNAKGDDGYGGTDRDRSSTTGIDPIKLRLSNPKPPVEIAKNLAGQTYNSSNLPDNGNKWDGSEFQTPSYMDSNFGRQSYRDSFQTKSYFSVRWDESDLSPARRTADKRKDAADDRRKELWRDLTRSTAIGDWVPSPADPTDNGGFGLGQDNGAPVPYNLNGFPNVQRKLPWQAGN